MDTIRGFVGSNGGGKTLCMVETLAVPAWEQGVPVVANFRLFPEALGFDPSLAIELRSWRDIGDLRGCRLLLDEISRVAPSRSSSSLPASLIGALEQLRKARVVVGWAGPSWKRCDVVLRDITQSVTVCSGLVPDRWVREEKLGWFPPVARDDRGRRMRIEGDEWPPNRLMRWLTYDAQEMDEFTFGAVRDVKPIRRRLYWRPRHAAQRAYDTMEQVGLLDHLDDVGVCVTCGGTRSRPKCSCAGRAGGVEAPSAPERRRPAVARVRAGNGSDGVPGTRRAAGA